MTIYRTWMGWRAPTPRRGCERGTPMNPDPVAVFEQLGDTIEDFVQRAGRYLRSRLGRLTINKH